jgi:L-ribulose-5-phosphate 3-epimerase
MHRLGVMQGRLSPMVDGAIQAFPVETWQQEFSLARDCGFDLIEWVLDLTEWQSNPLLWNEGRREIVGLQRQHSVAVPIICVDFFMSFGLLAERLDERLEGMGMLCELIRVCPEVGIHQIEIPLIGKSSIMDDQLEDHMVSLLQDIVPLAESKNTSLLLEVDLPPKRVQAFLEKIPSRVIQMNYDIGNSAYWGFSAEEEISLYGDRIGNVHIKDCTPEDYSVPLGKGNVDFESFFKNLRNAGYRGDFVLQAARGQDDVNIAREFCAYTYDLIERFLNGS